MLLQGVGYVGGWEQYVSFNYLLEPAELLKFSLLSGVNLAPTAAARRRLRPDLAQAESRCKLSRRMARAYAHVARVAPASLDLHLPRCLVPTERWCALALRSPYHQHR